MPIDTITPLRSNPSSFSFVMEPDSHAQLEPPVHSVGPMSHFVMAPQLGGHADTKNDSVDTDSNSSGSEDGDSSSDEESSDSDMDTVEDFFVPPMTTVIPDQTRSQLLVTSSVDLPTESTTVNVTSSVAVTAPTVVNKPPTSMKRLRNMFAAVKPPEITPTGGSNATVNTSAVQPLCPEAVTPVTPVSNLTTNPSTKLITSMEVTNQQIWPTVTTTTVTSEAVDTLQLPRNTKRMTSVSSKHNSKQSLLSEESSSDSEGEESGEVTNSDSEDEDTKPKPPKQTKWKNTLMATEVTTPETSKLQLVCSIPKEYMRTIHTPVSTPKSPVSKMSPIAIVT